jgi:protein O-GlcNAc transferase
LEQAVSADPNDAFAHFRNGVALAQAGRLGEATDSFRRAIELAPDFAEAHNLLGAALGALGQLDLAEASCRQAVRVKPTLAEAHLNLGTVLARQDQLDDAITCFRRATQLKPNMPEPYNNLASVLIRLNRFDEAEACCRQAVQLRPGFAEAHNTLAAALAAQGNLGDAEACCRRALALRGDFAEAHSNLGNVLEMSGRLEEAAIACRRALQLRPGFADATNNLASILARLGEVDEANQCYVDAQRANPDQMLWRLSAASVCSTVFADNEAIDAYRAGLLDELHRFAQANHSFDVAAVQSMGSRPSFNLQFHGRDDRPIREAYARIYSDRFPHEPGHGSGGRPRIGFVVTDRHEKGFVKGLGGVLERLDHDPFDLIVIGSHRGRPLLRNGIRNESVQVIEVPAPIDQAAGAIRDGRFDLLYYWEVGTDNLNYFLPLFRLAPVQCTSWGIQVTSGIDTVDHYISSQLIEPEGAAAQYTENLVLAESLLTYRPRVTAGAPAKNREHFGASPSQHLFVCAQQLGKFHPDFDPLLAGILRHDPLAIVVATEDLHGGRNADRLRQRFAKTMGDVADRIQFIPFLAPQDYLSLIAAADVLLDPLHFGGVNTTYDGLSLSKPIVTMPSQFQRGRYTLACYKKMGVSECIAEDPDDYVEIAVRLGTDADFRAHVSNRIRQTSDVLFEDRQAVDAHARIFRELIERAV